jgi:hypothetical protein
MTGLLPCKPNEGAYVIKYLSNFFQNKNLLMSEITTINQNLDTYIDEMIGTLNHINDSHLEEFRAQQMQL